MRKFPETMQALYHEVEVMKHCLSAGFATVAFGSGPWIDLPAGSAVNSQRLVRVVMLRHPDGRIIAREIWKMDDGITTVHAPAQVEEYREDTLAELLRRWQVKIVGPVPLTDAIAEVERLEANAQ